MYSPLADATSISEIRKYKREIESYDTPAHLDKRYEDVADKAKALRLHTDYLLARFFGGHIFQSSQSLRGWEKFLMDLLENQAFAEALMDELAEANIRQFERYATTMALYVDVIQFEEVRVPTAGQVDGQPVNEVGGALGAGVVAVALNGIIVGGPSAV